MGDFTPSTDFLQSNSISLAEVQDAFQTLSSLTSRLVITKVPSDVYDNDECKNLFENVFRPFDPKCEFIYLPSFRRVLINMSSTEAAFVARFKADGWKLPSTNLLHGTEVDEVSSCSGIKCYFGEIDANLPRPRLRTRLAGAGGSSRNQSSFEDEDLTDDNPEDGDDVFGNHLAPPKPQRLFLLSPPASPPVGWEPKMEAEPVMNYDLLSALAGMEPGKEHELHPPCTERDQPSIVVTPCDFLESSGHQSQLKITQTACPARKS